MIKLTYEKVCRDNQKLDMSADKFNQRDTMNNFSPTYLSRRVILNLTRLDEN